MNNRRQPSVVSHRFWATQENEMRLQDALIGLVPERGYAAITVEDMCAEANVGRSTFYSHYTGKDDLRRATIDGHLHAIRDKQIGHVEIAPPRFFGFSLPMFEHAHAFRALHRASLPSAGDSIHDEVRDCIRQSIRHALQKKQLGDEFVTEFIAGALLPVPAWWIGTDAGMSAIQIDERFQQLALRGLEVTA